MTRSLGLSLGMATDPLVALSTCKVVKTLKVEPPGWPEDAEADEFDEVWVTLWRFTFNFFRGWK